MNLPNSCSNNIEDSERILKQSVSTPFLVFQCSQFEREIGNNSKSESNSILHKLPSKGSLAAGSQADLIFSIGVLVVLVVVLVVLKPLPLLSE